MGKWTTGGAVAAAIWMAGAMAAQAQGHDVNVSNPSCVYHDQTQVTVTGTVTGLSSYLYNLTIKVNGATKHNKSYFNSGSAITKLVTGLSTWGLQAGQTFETKITVSGVSDTLAITVTQGGGTYLPARLLPTSLPAALKEEELAWEPVGAEEQVA